MRKKPIRIQRKRTRGFKLKSPNGLPIVYVGRPSRWSNPYRVGKEAFDKKDAVEMFVNSLRTLKALNPFEYKLMLNPLKGKNLACYCKLSEPCHADILLKIANKD